MHIWWLVQNKYIPKGVTLEDGLTLYLYFINLSTTDNTEHSSPAKLKPMFASLWNTYKKKTLKYEFVWRPGATSYCKKLHFNVSVSQTRLALRFLFSSQFPDVNNLLRIYNASSNSLYSWYGRSRAATNHNEPALKAANICEHSSGELSVTKTVFPSPRIYIVSFISKPAGFVIKQNGWLRRFWSTWPGIEEKEFK
jgi:hypothetical protein